METTIEIMRWNVRWKVGRNFQFVSNHPRELLRMSTSYDPPSDQRRMFLHFIIGIEALLAAQ